MNIAVELRRITFGASGGIAQLVHGVLSEAMRRNPEVRFVVFATMFNSEMFSEPLPNVEVRVPPLHSYWQDFAAAARQEAFDVIFRGYPGPEIAGYPCRRQVVLIPDLQHEALPEFFSAADLSTRRAIFHPALANAGAIGTISEFARSTLVADPANRCEDIFLMPPASQLAHIVNWVDCSAKFVEHVKALSPYLFYPANLWQHKNHERLLAAHEAFCAGAHAGVSLVLTGHPEGWNAKLGQRAMQRVHHLGFVSQAELRHLYRNALALVFPSLYEGFGMPLLEAFENDCPVACSNTTSLPEVAGDAALMFDPTSVASIAGAMTTIASDTELRESLVARGHARARNYSWSASADALVAACRRVASASSLASTSTLSSKMPLVSIVTPSFNQGRFLRRTIDSVLAQDYPNIEFCVMDGGSTDDSVAILQSYGERIRWVSEKDGGQTHAINKGLARSHGEVFAYLNSDDTLAPGAVRRIIEYLAANPSCDMVYGDANYIDESDSVTGKYNTAPYSFERLMFDCCVCQPAAFWRAAMSKTVGPFDESLDFVMDYDYWLRIARAGGAIRYLPEVLANSRLYPETKTMSRRGDVYREIFTVCRRHGGYVDRNYYLGYWNHLAHERPGLLGYIVRVVPEGVTLAAKAHFAWDRRQGSAWQFITREVPARLSNVVRHVKAALPGFGRSNGAPRVEGCFSDGWLAPLASIRKARDESEQRLFVSGRPAVPCVVDVDVDGVRVHTQRLSPEQISRIEIAAQGSERISLRFSQHAVDQANRRLAFLVVGTNLFSESDLMA